MSTYRAGHPDITLTDSPILSYRTPRYYRIVLSDIAGMEVGKVVRTPERREDTVAGADGNPTHKKASALRLCRIFYGSEPHPCPLTVHPPNKFFYQSHTRRYGKHYADGHSGLMWARIVPPCTILASGFARTKPAYLKLFISTDTRSEMLHVIDVLSTAQNSG